jgi:hypothetical protein
MFVPSQGFFNFIVYIRPRYRIVRRVFPGNSRWWALREVIWGSSVRRRKSAIPLKHDERNTSESFVQQQGECSENNDNQHKRKANLETDFDVTSRNQGNCILGSENELEADETSFDLVDRNNRRTILDLMK